MIDKKHSVFELENNISQTLKNFYDINLKEKILFFVYNCGGNTTVKNILENFKIVKSNLAVLLSILEEEGLIEKKKSKTDKRSIKIYITKQGKKICLEKISTIENDFVEKLGKEKYKKLCKLCDEANEILKG